MLLKNVKSLSIHYSQHREIPRQIKTHQTYEQVKEPEETR